MKFATLFTAAASLLAVANAAPTKRSETEVKLYVISPGTEVNNKGIFAKHEGAGVNYVFIGENTETYYFDETTSTLYQQAGDLKLPFVISGGIAQFSVAGGEPISLSFDHDYLAINGSTHALAACKNINDPYRYSENEWAVTYQPGAIPEDCIALQLKV